MWHILNIEYIQMIKDMYNILLNKAGVNPYIQMIKDMYNILLNKAGVNPLPWLLLAFRGGGRSLL